ncbi:GNAT family N-acetyltransferase [Aureivirga marina]|uniref:GNAT family N-acetyltransferase n=1 Tax=Aureivirga marina TaxID=1182451 RepID=UPI0018CAF0B3|nr:N-acetyltransferase [Aureivirga marina]
MEIIIRQEIKEDYPFVFNLIKEAFESEEFSDKKEHFLVKRLKSSTAFIPELSLVAIFEEKIVGHIILTKIQVQNSKNSFESLALAPVSVLPKYQNKGIGGKLIKKAHEIAKNLNFSSIILLGHEKYYPKFGYKQAHTFEIFLPFEVPKENCMAIELFENSLEKIHGTVVYPNVFFE